MYHYTYLTTDFKRRYIGVRSCKCHPSKDSYIGSHKDKTYTPKRKRVLALFKTRKEALQHEIDLHNKYEVATSEKYANQAKQTSTVFDTTGATSWNKGIPCSEITKQRIRDTFIKRGLDIGNPTPHTEETKQKLRLANLGSNHPQYGKPKSDITKQRISKARLGHDVSQDCRNKISSTLQQYKGEYRWFNFHTGEEVICSVYELMNNWGASNAQRRVLTLKIFHTNGWILL